MKRMAFFITFVFHLAIITHAQITITDADMPSVNDTFRVSVTTDTLDPELTGANYTWDFSGFIPVSQRLDTFVSVGATPATYQAFFNNGFLYPNHVASYAMPVATPDSLGTFVPEDVYNYYKLSTSKYEQVGFGAGIAGIPLPVQFNPIDVVHRFPMSYNDLDSSASGFGVSIPSVGYYGQSRNRVNTVDGWGTLTTPFGSFQVLRVRSVLNISDTIYIDSTATGNTIVRPTEIEYKWLGAAQGIPLLQVNAQEIAGIPVVTSVVYRDSVRFSGIGHALNPSTDIDIYPNPSNGKFTLRLKNGLQPERVTIYSINRQQVYEGRVSPGQMQHQLDFSHLRPGVYLIGFDGVLIPRRLVIQ